jgi:hypothetical protein
MPQICDMEPTASEGRRAEDFSALTNPTASAGFEPANLGTRGQHANPYTTDAASSKVGIDLLNTVPVDLILWAFGPFLFCNKECCKKRNSKFKEAVLAYLCCW